LSFKKVLVPAVSAIFGGLAVVAVLKMNPALHSMIAGNYKGQSSKAIYEDLLNSQEGIRNNFDDLFDEDFFGRQDPFKHMRRMHQEMERRMGNYAVNNLYDVSKREDDGYVYYDIKTDAFSLTSVDAKVENGYVTITATLEEKNRDEEKLSSQYFYKSKFNRTFPLPNNVNANKMQMNTEQDKIVLKFPKVNA